MPLNAAQLAELQLRLPLDLWHFSPELILCVAIVVMLLGKMISVSSRVHQSMIALLACSAAIAILVIQWLSFTDDIRTTTAFDRLLIIDPFSILFRIGIVVCTLLTFILGRMTGLPDRDDSADFGSLLLGATVGMMTMVTANHLIMLFLAVEMASLPSYVLTGFLKGRSKSSEASLKYVLFGAAASGMMLLALAFSRGNSARGNCRCSCWRSRNNLPVRALICLC